MDLNVKIITPASNIPAWTTDAASTRLWRHTPASVSNLTLGIPVSFSTAAQLVRQEDVSAFAIEICFSLTLYRLGACNSSFSGSIEFLLRDLILALCTQSDKFWFIITFQHDSLSHKINCKIFEFFRNYLKLAMLADLAFLCFSLSLFLFIIVLKIK